MNSHTQTCRNDQSLFRIIAIIVLLAVSGMSVFFLASRVMTTFQLHKTGLRHDVILILIVRDLSLVLAILSAAFLLVSLAFKLGKVSHAVAIVVLVSSVCSTVISVNAERRMWLRIQNNLQNIHRALENYKREKDASGSPTAPTPEER